MTETMKYASHLEKKLIDEFKQKFQDKLGYEPIILTRVQTDKDNYIPIMSLEELKECFTPFLPERHGKQLPLSSRWRYRELVELRNIYCSLARMMGYTLKEIGYSLGGRDHTTAMHNIGTFNTLIGHDVAFRRRYAQILDYIKQKHDYEPPVVDDTNQACYQPQPAVLP